MIFKKKHYLFKIKKNYLDNVCEFKRHVIATNLLIHIRYKLFNLFRNVIQFI